MRTITIPFPLIEAVDKVNSLLRAIVVRGLELGLKKNELPCDSITPRSYRWTENPPKEGEEGDTVIRFTLWGGGPQFYVRGTVRGFEGNWGTSWDLEAFEVRYRHNIAWQYRGRIRIRLNMDAKAIVAVRKAVYQASHAWDPIPVVQDEANVVLDATLVKLLNAVEVLRKDPMTVKTVVVGDED